MLFGTAVGIFVPPPDQCVIQHYELVGSFINIIGVFILKLLILILTTSSYEEPSLPPLKIDAN